MSEIDHDSEAVEFANNRAAKGVEAIIARRVSGGIDPIERFVVAKGHQPYARSVPDTQGTERILEPHAALDCNERSDLAHRLRARIMGGPPRWQEHVGGGPFGAAEGGDLLPVG